MSAKYFKLFRDNCLEKLYDHMCFGTKITIECHFYTHKNNILLPCRHNTDGYTKSTQGWEVQHNA